MSKFLQKVDNRIVAAVAFVVAMVGTAVPAMATATYDITPVTTSVGSELTANLPVILGVVGALFALGIAIRAIRKFVKV